MKTLSIVISAYNEEEKIEDCLKSLKNLGDEIIVVDNNSTDATAQIAKKFTKKVYSQKNDPANIDVQKNYGFSKATSDWILSLDADERVTEELASEISSLINKDSDLAAYEMARKNIIFGKWIEHTGWYPDYQLRLFRKGQGKFVKSKVHEPIMVDGEVGRLSSNLVHENYQTINQFITRMLVYTDSEASAFYEADKKVESIDVVRMPLNEFLRRYFTNEGYKDGLHGLALSLLMGFYHLVIFLKMWEMNKFKEDNEIREKFDVEAGRIKKELSYWIADTKKKNTKNPIKKAVISASQKLQK